MAEKEKKDNPEEQAVEEKPQETEETSEAKPKSRKLIYAAAVIIIVAVIAAVILIGPQMTGQVTGNQTTGNANIGNADLVESGDTIKVSYTGTLLSGEEFDSGEISFEVGAGQMIQGFDEAVVGMDINEEKDVTIPPEKAYGEYDPSRIDTIELIQEVDKVDEVTMTAEQFESSVGEAPVAGQLYETPWAPWDLKVIEVGEDTITLEHMPIGGQTISLSYGTGTVTLKGDKIVITVAPEIGKTISTAYGQATILEGDNQSEVKVDFNHELAGKTLVFSIKVLEIEKPMRYDKPVLDAFIMSYCPYGLQMAKALIPVQELLGEKADINIRFVNYAMHGEKEAVENLRMMCLREEQPELFWDYMKCFTESDDADACLASTGVNMARLGTCMSLDWEESDYYAVDDALNEKHGVQGSPTTVLNGKVTSISRSPNAVKEAICNTFDDPPAECSQELSTAQASAGFGAGTSTSSSGSC